MSRKYKMAFAELDSIICENIRLLRHERRLLQKEVSYAIGLSAPSMNRIEKGHYRITAVQLLKLCAEYKIDPMTMSTPAYPGKFFGVAHAVPA